jgi:hypothetical protein
MAAKTQTVIDSVTDITKDYDHVRWSLAEISRWMNQAAGEIATMHPRASAQYLTLTLGAGVRQDLRVIDSAKAWIRLHELVCNVSGSDPTGPTIRLVSRSAMDSVFRTWRASTGASAVKEYTLDEREPFTFDVYPPQSAAGTKVLALASVRPAAFCVLNAGATALSDASEVIPLADGFEVPLIDYTLFRMFSKDANDPAYAGRAAMHLQAFQGAMGIETKDAKSE